MPPHGTGGGRDTDSPTGTGSQPERRRSKGKRRCVCVCGGGSMLLGWVPFLFFALSVHYLLVCYIHVCTYIFIYIVCTCDQTSSFIYTSLFQ